MTAPSGTRGRASLGRPAFIIVAWAAGLVGGGPSLARADEPSPDGGVPAADAGPPEAAEEKPRSTEERLRALEEQNERLQEQLRILREDQERTAKRHEALSSKVSGRFTGYLDFGAFNVTGNGSGIRSDSGHAYFPQYSKVPDSWVFFGDPLSTAINSRGDPADTGDSRAVTLDGIHNGGKASFIVNSINLGIFAGLTQHLTVNALIDFIPRSRDVSIDASSGAMFGSTAKNPSALGDYLDIKLAYAEYKIPTRAVDISLYAGKFDSVLGIEYRWQESPDRITVTPSLICRYTCGHPLGVKARLRFGEDDRFVFNIAFTNGSHQVEYFPFYDEIDTNLFKTVAVRLSTNIPVGKKFEIGASGAFGAQDFQTSNTVWQWHYGADLTLQIKDFDLRGEFVQGAAEGKDDVGDDPGACGLVPCIHYKGAYGQVAYRVANWFMPYVRVDWRNALHRSGQSFVYISDEMRITGGARFEIREDVIVKAEYTRNQELGDVPQFPNDVFTSSLVLKY